MLAKVNSAVMNHPLMSMEARSSRIIQNVRLQGLNLPETTRSNIAGAAIASDNAMLEKAFAGQIFEGVPSLRYEGPKSQNPLSFKTYDPHMVVDGKSMKDQLRICVAFWHAMNNDLSDPFGPGTLSRPWDNMYDPLAQSVVKLDGAFELMEKIGFPYWAFHDYDLIGGNNSLYNMATKLDFLTEIAHDLQSSSGIKLAWNTNQLFALPVYREGAATAPDTWPFLRAVAQCKQSFKMSIKLGAEGFVFWGGREGFVNLINTITKTEKDHLAIFLSEVIKMGREMGYKGEFWIEPKAFEPSMYQYDRSVEVVQGFLKEYGLSTCIKINFEPNHEELAGLSAEHGLDAAGMQLGSVDINSGRFGIGYDVDEFTNFMTALAVMRAVRKIRKNGGFEHGFMNIDAKLRRTSTDFPADLFHGCIKTADNLAAAYMVAAMEGKDQRISRAIADRYSSWGTGLGSEILGGKWDGNFGALADHVVYREKDLAHEIPSGGIEQLENIQDQALFAAISEAYDRSQGEQGSCSRD